MNKAKSNSPSSNKTSPNKASNSKAKASKPSSPGISGSKKAAIFQSICEFHANGMEEVTKLDVALSVGNKNPRSAGFSQPFKELLDGGLVGKGSKKESFSLTQEGINKMPSDLDTTDADPSATRDRYVEFVAKKLKCGVDKIRKLWDILSDREDHAITEIASELGYSNPRSFGNTKIVATMKEMGLVEGKGRINFTNKVPH